MDNRFCSPHWSHSAVRPRCHINDVGVAQNHKTPARATPKVVQIPVRFVDSEPSKPNSALLLRGDSALKIQKVFRGFLIRSRVEKILELKKKANEIEDRMSRSETVELIQRDHRERLRINEMLMALLLKLDSIRGIDAGVRDCRKTVIKKVISLQERLDSISDQIQFKSPDESQDNESSVDSALSNSGDESGQSLLDNEIHDSENNVAIKEPDSDICFAEEKCFNNEAAVIKSIDEENYDTSRDEFEEAKSEEDTSFVKETGEIRSIMTHAVSECVEETMGSHSVSENNDIGDKIMMVEENGGQKKEDEITNQQVLKRLMEDNQTMMNMMTQLFERNEMQTQMLTTLRNKVEFLEKAFVCDRMRRKKKRHS